MSLKEFSELQRADFWERLAATIGLCLIALSLALAALWNGWDGPDTWPTKEERGQSGHQEMVYKR